MEITHLDPDPEVWGKEEKTEKRHVDRYVTLLTDIQIRTYTHAYIQLDETEAGRYTRGIAARHAIANTWTDTQTEIKIKTEMMD